MKTKQLGSSDLQVPVICLGTMTWGNKNSEKDAHEQLDYAIHERGLTFLDTAEAYPIPPDPRLQGLTETYIGNWIKKNGGREKLVIATKVSPAPFIRTRETSETPMLSRKNIQEAVEGSLKRLRTDYIDLYQIHWPVRRTNFFGLRAFPYDASENISTPMEEILESLAELIKAGKIRYIGVSNETAWGVSEYLRLAREKGLPKIVSIQNQYSLTNRTFEIGMSEFCMREDIGLLPYSPLDCGVLSGKYLSGQYPKNSRFALNSRNEERYNPKNQYAQEAIRRYVQIAKDNDLDPAQMAIAYTCSKPFTASTIIGATTLDQLKNNIQAGELELPETVFKSIELVYQEFPDVTV